MISDSYSYKTAEPLCQAIESPAVWLILDLFYQKTTPLVLFFSDGSKSKILSNIIDYRFLSAYPDYQLQSILSQLFFL